MQSNANYNNVIDYSFSAEKNGEPVTKEQVKGWLKITNNDDDFIIDNLIIAARSVIENYINRSLKKRTVTATLINRLGNIELPYQPFIEIVGVLDADGNAVTNYQLKGDTFKRLAYPCGDGIKISYKAGYENDCPQIFKSAILAQVAFMYENRGEESAGKGISPIAKQFLATERR